MSLQKSSEPSFLSRCFVDSALPERMHAEYFLVTGVIIPVSHIEKEKTGREDNNEDNVYNPEELVIVHGTLPVSHRHLSRFRWFDKPKSRFIKTESFKFYLRSF